MTAAERIMAELDKRSRTLSVEQLLGELQIAVERITFTSSSRSLNDVSYSDIEQIFEGQLSKTIVDFIHWLRENSLLAVLAGNTGRRFLNHCIKRYRSIQQVIFKTAISLPDVTKEAVQQSLAPLYPKNTRVLFEVDASIVAGFSIRDESGLIDKTMRSATAVLARKRLMGN